MAATTARYMGLRTYRYRPPITRCSVGATGEGVPSPSMTNRAKAWTRTNAPRTRRITPPTRRAAQWASGPRTCQCVSHQGTRPATTPGATAKNSALPAAAVGLRILAPSPVSVGGGMAGWVGGAPGQLGDEARGPFWL